MTRSKWAIVLAVLVGVSGCQLVERGPVAEGPHVICDVGDQQSPHLPLNSRIVINRLGGDMRPTEVDFPDGTRAVLATFRSVALAGAYTAAEQQHFVRIRPDPDYRKNNPRGTCKSDNVHIIEMCFREANATSWRCGDDPAHYGHVHSDPSD